MTPLGGLEAHCKEIRITPETSFGVPAVYLLLQGERVVYVGSTANIEQRIALHIGQSTKNGWVTPPKQFDRVLYLRLPVAVHAHYEGALIRGFRPEFNGRAPTDHGNDAEILDGLDLSHLIADLKPFGSPWGRAPYERPALLRRRRPKKEST